MVEAADAWHPGGLTFRQFVSTRLEQRMIDEARRSGGLKRGKSSSRDAYSLDAQAGHGDESDGATHGDLLEARVRRAATLTTGQWPTNESKRSPSSQPAGR